MSTQEVTWNGASAVAVFGGCDCVLYAPHGTTIGDVQDWDRCPMHEAARAMLAALLRARERIEPCRDHEAKCGCPRASIDAAISQAKGEA